MWKSGSQTLTQVGLLGSHETVPLQQVLPLEITFVTSQNGGDHLLNGCNVTGTVLKAVCALGQLILIQCCQVLLVLPPFHSCKH